MFGLSGGIDSALVAMLAVDALGRRPRDLRGHALALLLARRTQSDARTIAANLGTELRRDRHRARDAGRTRSCWPTRSRAPSPDITEENLQARIRGNLVMALSNKFGWLVLTTGNKSELSVGYATLYGDMAGGFAVLKDVFKGWVYRLVRVAQRSRRGASWCPPR